MQQVPYGHPHQPAYPAASYAPPYTLASTSSAAIVSLVFGILGWTLLPLLGAVIAVIAGHVAHAEIRRTGMRGDGMALAGLVLGWLQLIPVALLVGFAVLMGAALLSGMR